MLFAFVVGDNLGSHMLGGVVESFSAVSHCCRYCLIPKGDLTNGKISPMWHEPRNADNYNACVQENSRTGETHCKGVKIDSV